MDTILALDTSSLTARVAVLDASGLTLSSGEATSARHSSNLLRLCDQALRDANVAVTRLRAIVCGSGPGSFTGLRVGLAVAKGFCLPTGTPLLLVPSLQALALDLVAAARGAKVTGEGAVLIPCLDAGKEQVYAALFRLASARDGTVERLSDDWAIAPEELVARLPPSRRVIAGGPGVERYAGHFDRILEKRGRRVPVAGPTAESVGLLGRARLTRGEADDLATAVPSYGRAPDITTPKAKKGGRRQRPAQ